MLERLAERARRLGLVAIVVLAAVVVAAFVHHASRLPPRYSWRFSPELLWDNVREPWFPVIALVAAALGFSRRGALAEPIRAASRLRRLVALAVGVAAALGAFFLAPAYEPIDLACLALLAGYVALLPTPPWASVARMVAEQLFAMAAYVLASYAHTVGKSLMLLRPARDAVVVGVETALFGTPIHAALTAATREAPALLAAASRLYRTQTHQLLLYAIFLSCAADKRMRREFLAVVAVALVLGAPLYHVVPCVGPVYVDAAAYRHLAGVSLVSDWYEWLWRNTTDTLAGRSGLLQTYQYVAAMPSLHVGFTAAMVYATWRFPVLRTLSIGLALATWGATMVLGWHYFLDGFFGLLLTAVVIALVRKASDWLLPAVFHGPAAEVPWPSRRSGVP